MSSALTEAIYTKLVAANLAPVYRNAAAPHAHHPFIVIGGSSEAVRPLTLDGTGIGMTKTIRVIDARKADSSAVDDLAEAVATALAVSPSSYVAAGWRIERIVLNGPLDLDLDEASYGRSISLSLEASKVP